MMKPFWSLLPCVLSSLVLVTTPSRMNAADPLVFVSSFAPGEKGGIQAYHLDLPSGKLTPAEHTGEVENPFFLALSPDHRFLYAIQAKAFGGKENEEVAAYALVGSEGKLRLLNRQSTKGSASCHLETDATGRTLLVANYSSGSVASLPVLPDGSLAPAASFDQHMGGSGVEPKRQDGPYAHSFIVSPDNRFAYSADLGLDQILCYRLDAAEGRVSLLTPPSVAAPPGAGPRHLAFHPGGKWLYAINELANSVTRYDWDAGSGALTAGESASTLPDGFTGKSYCADLKITPDGKFLYGTNRGHDSVACYRVGGDGHLERFAIVPSLGKGPQNLAITPDGRWLLCANMPGNTVVVFSIDASSGILRAIGDPVPQTSPACIRLVP
ncbi:MAG: lactonase family protein [Verrucomicrobiales bacterium]